jgi:WD40 repeat protein
LDEEPEPLVKLRLLHGHAEIFDQISLQDAGVPDDGTELTLVRCTVPLVLTGSCDRTAKLWNSDTGECFKTFEGHGDAVYAAAFSPDGATVLTGSSDGTAML